MANAVLYGFYSLQDLLTQRVSTTDIQVINRAIDDTLAEHNRQLAALNRLFINPTTEYKVRYKQAGNRRLQPLDEYGRPRPTKTGSSYDVAFPLSMGGDAFGQTFLARAKMTVQEVNDELNAMLIGDRRWMRDHLLAALFANASYSYTDDLHGALTIMPLANSDTVTYTIMAGADSAATDTHFLAQASAIADATNPYPTIYSELTEHPENTGEVVVMIATDLVATTQALTNFKEVSDPNVRPGANTDVVTGTPGVPLPGRLIGYVDGCWVVEWKSLPSTYIVGVTTGGERPIGMREEPEAELRGFRRVADEQEFPFYKSTFIRRAGFGAWNRVGAVVMRIGNGSYAVPTNYDVPMP